MLKAVAVCPLRNLRAAEKITTLVASAPDCAVCGCDSCCADLDGVSGSPAVDVIVVPLGDPSLDDVAHVLECKAFHHPAKVIAVSPYEHPHFMRKLLAHGASKVVALHAATTDLLPAIRSSCESRLALALSGLFGKRAAAAV